MRAWQVAVVGEPSAALRVADVAALDVGPRQLRVRVLAAPANFPDVLLCRGEYQMRPELPFTPGVEACGEVLAVGSDVVGSIRPYSMRTTAPTEPVWASSTTMPSSTGRSVERGLRCGLLASTSVP